MGVAAAITAAASVGSAVSSHNAAKANRQFQERQRQIQIRIDRLNARREKVSAYRDRLRAEAETTQQGVNTGATSPFVSSGYQGAIASLDSQYTANEAYVDKVDGLTNFSNNQVNQAGKYESLSNLFGSVGSLSGNNFGGYSELNDISRNMFRRM